MRNASRSSLEVPTAGPAADAPDLRISTEVRGSDYFGPGATDQSYLGDRFLVPFRAGKSVPLVWFRNDRFLVR